MKNNQILYVLSILISLITLTILTTGEVSAFEKTARPSATLASVERKAADKREEILRKYLEKYNSQLAPSAGKFIEEADKNNLDWKLLVSIAGVESYFGKHIPPNSYNGWGWGVYNGNVHNFTSWDEAITVISGELRTKYMDKWGAENVSEIGSFYAADPNWSNKVTHFMDELEAFAEKEDTTLLSISI